MAFTEEELLRIKRQQTASIKAPEDSFELILKNIMKKVPENVPEAILKNITERLHENIFAINVSLYEIGNKLAQLSTPNTLLLEDETERVKEESVVGVITDNVESLERINRTLLRFKNHLDTIL